MVGWSRRNSESRARRRRYVEWLEAQPPEVQEQLRAEAEEAESQFYIVCLKIEIVGIFALILLACVIKYWFTSKLADAFAVALSPLAFVAISPPCIIGSFLALRDIYRKRKKKV